MTRILLVAFALLAAAAPQSLAAGRIDSDAIDDCLEVTPAAVAIPPGTPIELRVHLVLDDTITEAEGREAVRRAGQSYEGLGINLTYGGARRATLTKLDSSGALEEVKAATGGKRPPYAHLVYGLTNKELDGGGTLGLADCIGGVAFDESAFAIGQISRGDGPDLGATTLSHELGHLMGAHHHYANCLEGATAFGTPCTIMFNFGGLSVYAFSKLNGLVVRGHAEEFVKPLPPVPPDSAPASAPSEPAPPAPAAPAPDSQPAPAPARPVPGSQPTPPSGTAPRPRPSAACVRARRALKTAVTRERRARGSQRRRLATKRAKVQRTVRRACR